MVGEGVHRGNGRMRVLRHQGALGLWARARYMDGQGGRMYIIEDMCTRLIDAREDLMCF